MEQKNIVISVLVVVLLAVSVILSSVSSANQTVTLAIAETQHSGLAASNKIEIQSSGQTYFLSVHKVDSARATAEFSFTSELSGVKDYIYEYFTLDSKLQTQYHPITGEVYLTNVGNLKRIDVEGGDQIQIKLVSVNRQKADISIKKVPK